MQLSMLAATAYEKTYEGYPWEAVIKVYINMPIENMELSPVKAFFLLTLPISYYMYFFKFPAYCAPICLYLSFLFSKTRLTAVSKLKTQR